MMTKKREAGRLAKRWGGSSPKKRDGNLPKGVMRREATGELVCDVRFKQCNVKGKFHATQIESLEEGAFFYDIVKLYEWRLQEGRRRPLKLNYLEVSSCLGLIDLPEDFHIKDNKEQAQKLILEQARRAARGLVQSQKCSRHVGEGSQSTLNDQTSPHQNARGIKLGIAEDQLDLAGMDSTEVVISKFLLQKSLADSGWISSCSTKLARNVLRPNETAGIIDAHGVQRISSTHIYDTFQHNVDQVHTICMDIREKACELFEQCHDQYKLKVSERKDLERKVAGINEAWGNIISLPNLEPEVFYECFKAKVTFIKRIIRRDGELFLSLERFEQAYKSEESKCRELRKSLEEHNLKSISACLIENQIGNEMEALHVIRSISEQLVESPKDVLENPWVPLLFPADCLMKVYGIWDLSKMLDNSPK